ncbi:MAG TPA: peptidoglycan DD-metalloendopeptidase family protein [Aggregatilinea sp.]|uniref:M23 family metallopeptidase n=1 Tax=Aggregatilinea sp. TaxID=2806333 RepID=UPI002C3D7496|nr:peptidoglycan DD-metalloendopeptidase family protein [Aggregatilinea sp.]HML22684.1 peptidoglycan DD-metalloendopeptidase family protein [Aggregatilinea sp.]
MKHLVRLIPALALLLALAAPLAVNAQGDEPPAIPTGYADVAEEYTAQESTAQTLGSAAIDLFLAQEFEALYGQFSDNMAAAVTADALEQGYAQITATAPIGEPVSARVMSVGGMAVYMADYTWGDSLLTLTTAFNDSGEIDGLNLAPNAPLPDDPAQDYVSDATFQFPMDGLWYTAWGGPDRIHNYHVDAASQRHAYDFIVWQNGSTFSGDGTANEDYYAYGQPVYAPADGTVVKVVDGLSESAPQIETDAENPAGNHVVIQVGEAEYLYLAHMQPGSILVAEGDTVEAGQQIGLVGNSGNTSEPHLHIHLQDQIEMFVTDDSGTITALTDTIGLPFEFSNVLVNGELAETSEPLGGQFIQNAE